MSPLELLNSVINDPTLFKYMFLAFIAFNILIIVIGILVKNKTVSYLGSGLTLFFIVLFCISSF
ncbi:TPA: hypothetical protein ACGW5B_005884 [Bacillus paranthracis]|uniref:hypothetical protein n=1 Tax=Bacillus TaxID=1386 RepID=UPI000789F78D|nr:hypothetical protein B4079_5635 [Bacillus cereus]